MEHKGGEGYSGRNPVPTIQNLEAEQKRWASQMSVDGASSNKSLPPTPAAKDEGQKSEKSAAEQKKEMMDRLQPPKGSKPTDAAKSRGERWELDPVTKQQVLIKDLEFGDFRDKDLDNAALDPSNPKGGPALRKPPDSAKQSSKHIAPSVADVGNICLQQFPPTIDPVDVNHALSILRTGAIATSVGCAVIWFFVAFGKGVSWWGFFFRTGLLCIVAAMAWIGAENAGRKVSKELERIRMRLHEQRAESFSPPTPESVEWMNALVKLIWGLVNPDMFVPIVDMVEDVLQASLPSFVNAVKIADIGQGTNPLRIVSMRALPDQPGHKDYPREEWVGLDKDTQSKIKAEKAAEGKSDDPAKDVSGLQDDDQSGDYLNYEVSVSYQAHPGQSKNLRFHNMHLVLEFFLGAFDWFRLPVPFYAVVEGFVATARLRIQFIQSPPFVRNLTVTLMGVPKVEVSVEPFTTKLPNVLDLPLIQKFVEMGIAAACAEYVAPKSLTLNLAQMLVGDGIKKDTRAKGVLVVHIHHAIELSAQDQNGSSDPYIVLSWAKFGKPIHSTRVILEDLNPVFEETAYMLVTDDEIKAQEDLAVTLWDSDKRSADDLVGRTTVSLGELLKKPNQMHSRVDHLQGFEDANDMPGKLHWEVGYYEKMPLNYDLKKVDNKPEKPENSEDVPEKKESEDKPTAADSQEEKDALRIPPDLEVPTGVLSVIVHQINNLERQDIKGNTGDREGQAGQDTSEPAEEGPNLPNAYCEIILNDDMVYKTRVKQCTSMPYFEAGCERFIKDWRQTVVRVQVRDARTREKDPVLGIVTVKLTDLFKESSEVTQLFSIQEGIGFGRANISFLFRQIKTELPRNLLGWDTGTVEILGSVTITPTSQEGSGFTSKKLRVSTTEQSVKPSPRSASLDGGSITWDLSEDKVRLPVYNRYASAVLFEFGSGGVGPFGASADFVASVWLRDVVDDEETEIKVPILKSSKLKQLRQNYINDRTAETHDYEVVGYLTCTLVLDSGLDADHASLQMTRPDKHRYEAYDRVEGQALLAERNAHANDDGIIDSKEKKAIAAEKRRQLNMRHRGIYRQSAVRTGVWAKEGVQRKITTFKQKVTGNEVRKPNVESEA